MRRSLALATVIALGTLATRAQAQQPAPPPSGTATDIGVAPPPPPPPQTIVVQPPGQPEKPKKPPHQEKEWYGWQVLIADAAAVGLFAGGVVSKTTSIADVGYGTFLLAPPVVHFTHGNVGIGFGSFGLRLVVPWLFAGIGAVVGVFVSIGRAENDAHSIFDGPQTIIYGAIGGLVVGYLTAVGIDVGILSWEKVNVEDDNKQWGKAPRKPQPWFTVRPMLDAGAHHGLAGVGGTF